MSPVERMTIKKIYTLPADLQQQILAFAEFVEFRAKSNLDANTQASTWMIWHRTQVTYCHVM